MSRVVYSDTLVTDEQQALRVEHQVRLVSGDEEGSGVNLLPSGVFGYTYAPALPNAPLFAVPRYRSYETHKLPSGEVYIVGFATLEDAALLVSSAEEATIRLQPQPEAGAATLVKIPYARIRHHRQYAAPNQHGFTVTVSSGFRSAEL
jgi:hypothetical protein